MDVETDLCHANFGNGDTYRNPKYDPFNNVENYEAALIDVEAAGNDPEMRRRAIRDTAPAMYFTCAEKADGAAVYPCTGSAHRYGVHIICSCSCHRRPA